MGICAFFFFLNQTALVLRKTKNDTLESYTAPIFYSQDLSFRMVHFLICLDPDFLCPGLYWPCRLRQNPDTRMTTQQQRKTTEVPRATGTSHVADVPGAPSAAGSSLSAVWFLLLYPLVLFSSCLLLLSRDGIGI